jgi:predicted RecB family nuclease
MAAMTTKTINTEAVCKLLNVPKNTFNTARPLLVGFPRPVGKTAHGNQYLPADIKRWARGKDVKRLVMDAYQTRKTQQEQASQAKLERFNQALFAFNSGAYLTAEQRERLELKKLVARATHPKTERVRLNPDWMTPDAYELPQQRRTHG